MREARLGHKAEAFPPEARQVPEPALSYTASAHRPLAGDPPPPHDRDIGRPHFAGDATQGQAMDSRAWGWTPAAAAVAVLALLLAFEQVVRHVVQQGEVRRRTDAAYADGLWRCNALRQRQLRADCMTRLDGVVTALEAPTLLQTDWSPE